MARKALAARRVLMRAPLAALLHGRLFQLASCQRGLWAGCLCCACTCSQTAASSRRGYGMCV